MVLNRRGKAKTVTTIVVCVGNWLQPTSPFQPGFSLMRYRRLSSAPPSAGISRQMTSRTGNSGGTGSSSRRLGSSLDNFDNDTMMMENVDSGINNTEVSNNAPSHDPVPTTSANSTITSRGNSSTPGAAFTGNDTDVDFDFDIGNSKVSASKNDMYFSIPQATLEDCSESDEQEGPTGFVDALKKTILSLKEESSTISVALLNLVAIIWGSQHAIIKTVVNDSDPAAFTFLRFGLASLIASPYLPGIEYAAQKATDKIITKNDPEGQKLNDIDLWTPWRWGIEMGLWMFLGFSLQAIGLQTTTAQRSGFLLYLNVKFVPFFAKLLLDRQISTWTWISAFAAFSGTALLALDGQSLGLNVGDIWSVLAAAASAMFILRLEKASSEVSKSSELNATSLAVVAILSGAWLLLGNNGQQIASELTETVFDHPLELVYLGAVSTALANFIQAKAQKDVPAERASIIYSLDPVYGAFFSWVILGETLGGPQAYVGASIIFVAAATNSLIEFSKVDERCQ